MRVWHSRVPEPFSNARAQCARGRTREGTRVATRGTAQGLDSRGLYNHTAVACRNRFRTPGTADRSDLRWEVHRSCARLGSLLVSSYFESGRQSMEDQSRARAAGAHRVQAAIPRVLYVGPWHAGTLPYQARGAFDWCPVTIMVTGAPCALLLATSRFAHGGWSPPLLH